MAQDPGLGREEVAVPVWGKSQDRTGQGGGSCPSVEQGLGQDRVEVAVPVWSKAQDMTG